MIVKLEIALQAAVCAWGVSVCVLVRSRSRSICASYSAEGVVQCAIRFPSELGGEALGSQKPVVL